MACEQPPETSPGLAEPACSRFRLWSIALLSITLGIATNRWMYASSNLSYVGTLQVKSVAVRAPVGGIFQAWAVEEGTQIDPQVLVCTLSDDNLDQQIQSQQREVARLDARLSALKAEVDVKLHDLLRELDGDIYATQLQTADLLQKKYLHEIELMAWRDAREQNRLDDSPKEKRQKTASLEPVINSLPISSSSSLTDTKIDALLKEEAALNAFEVAKEQLEICSQRLNELQTQKKNLLEKVRQANGLTEVEIQLNQAKAELEEMKHRQSQLQIYSPEQGTISNYRPHPGEKVTAGEVIAELYQMEEAYIVAHIPCSDVGKFQVESTVKCLFPNGEKRTGIVTHVALTAEQTDSSTPANTPTVPIRIEQTGALWPSIPVGGHVRIFR